MYQITGTVYRGAQPTQEGIASLHRMGIKTVISLRRFHDDTDKTAAVNLSDKLTLFHLPMNAWDVSIDDIVQFLRIVRNEANHPVFFHCKHGSDRTGTMAAAYRMVVEGWTATDAVQEMKRGGFGYHTIWRGLPKTLLDMDVPETRRLVGVKSESP
ncbi:MAG: tyrosine-protein phosphatase [Deltaproteobacteria bacterium]|nr:tyrosine-protein phosphatase [Deltaproteobacteria bacterium]